MDRIKNYDCCRTGDWKFLVCSMKSWNSNPPQSMNATYTVPKYSYCHEVTIEPNAKLAKCSCKQRRSHGRPCVHVMKVLKNRIHGSMFHPRYLKIINSPLYDNSPHIRSLYQEMTEAHRQDPDLVPLSEVWENLIGTSRTIDDYEDLVSGNRKQHMVCLRKWNVEGKPFDRYSVNDFPWNQSVSKDDESIDRDIGMYIDFDAEETYQDKEKEGNSTTTEELVIGNEFPDPRVWYNQMSSELHEIAKLCETKPSSRKDMLTGLMNMKNKLKSDVHTELLSAGIIEDEGDAKMVSSNMQMELSPMRKRLKSGYETNH